MVFYFGLVLDHLTVDLDESDYDPNGDSQATGHGHDRADLNDV